MSLKAQLSRRFASPHSKIGSAFHVVGHGTVGEREVVMQYPMAMLGVGDQKVKREIRCRRWDGACTPVAKSGPSQ